MDNIGQYFELTSCWALAAFDALKLGAIDREGLQALGIARIALVGNIVCAAREAINGFNRAAQAFGQKDGRYWKVFVMVYGHRGECVRHVHITLARAHDKQSFRPGCFEKPADVQARQRLTV